MISLSTDWQNRKKKIMSYRESLKKRISELEFEIRTKADRKQDLEKELQELMRRDFEEEMREENQKQLLKG